MQRKVAAGGRGRGAVPADLLERRFRAAAACRVRGRAVRRAQTLRPLLYAGQGLKTVNV